MDSDKCYHSGNYNLFRTEKCMDCKGFNYSCQDFVSQDLIQEIEIKEKDPGSRQMRTLDAYLRGYYKEGEK